VIIEKISKVIKIESLKTFNVYNFKSTSNDENQKEKSEEIINKIYKNNKNLEPDVDQNLKILILENLDVFFSESEDLSVNNFHEQSISLEDEKPVYTKSYRLPHTQKEEINKQVENMLKTKVIEPSVSNYNNAILLVPKKSQDGNKKWRLVVDFRNINKNVVADKFPLPRIDEILDQLGRAIYFTRKIQKYNVSSDTGSYRYTKLPFWLSIIPNSFQQMTSLTFASVVPSKAFL
jgi:hypothetical protein